MYRKVGRIKGLEWWLSTYIPLEKANVDTMDCDKPCVCSAISRVTTENIVQIDALKKVDKSKWNAEECPNNLLEDR